MKKMNLTSSQGAMQTKQTFLALTGLRWLLAFAVWFHHFPLPISMPDWIASVIREGHIGVSLFFVLSGFLITLRYYKTAPKGFWVKAYLRNRFARIYPVYFLISVVTLCLVPLAWGAKVDYVELLLNLTMLRGFFDNYKFSGVPQGWSLTVEACFYLFAPLLFSLWQRFRVRTWVVVAAVYLCGGLLLFLGESIELHSFFKPLRFTIIYTFFGHAFTFLSGAAVGRAMACGSWKSPFANRKMLTTLGITGIALSALLLSFGQSTEYEFGVFNPYFWPVYFLVLPLAGCSLIAGLIEEETAVKKILSTKPFVELGKASYVFYLIHLGLLHEFILSVLGERFSAPVNYSITLGFLTAASILIYYTIESPLNLLLRSRNRAEGISTPSPHSRTL